MAWAAVVAATLLVAGALAVYAAYRDLFTKIHHVRVTGLGKRPPQPDSSLNILVIGSDTRKGKNSRFGAHVTGQRSDTVLVLHLSPGHRRAVVLSIPRDSVVPVLACPPVRAAPGQPAQAGQLAQPGQVEQINATFANGGPGCLWKTIEQTTRIRIDHFIELSFIGFERVINDLGGVTVCLPYAINDPHSKLRLSAGLHHVMGAQALAYWRVRYIGMGSDLERIQRDQFLMASVAQDVNRADLLGNPEQVYKIVADIASSLTTDSRFGQSTMISLVLSLRGMRLSAVHFVQTPVVFYPPNPNWVEWSPQATALFGAIARDRALPKASSPAKGKAAGKASGKASAGTRRNQAHGRPGRVPGGTTGRDGGRAPNLAGLSRRLGGITASTSVCRDSHAFAGPLGGH